MDSITSDRLQEIIELLGNPEVVKQQDLLLSVVNSIFEVFSTDIETSALDILRFTRIISPNGIEGSSVFSENQIVVLERVRASNKPNFSQEAMESLISRYVDFTSSISTELARIDTIRTCLSPFGASKPSYDAISGDVNNRLIGLEKEFGTVQTLAVEASNITKNLNNSLDDNKISTITALTIFSAVVLAFSGGISFEASALQSISRSTPYRLTFIIALTGFILFNTIFILLYTVGKMTSKKIGAQCRYQYIDNSPRFAGQTGNKCKMCGTKLCAKKFTKATVFCRLLHKYLYALLINLILLWIMYSAFIMWILRSTSRFNIATGALIVVPVLLIIVGYPLIMYWRRHNQMQRRILHEKVYLVGRYLDAKKKGTDFEILASDDDIFNYPVSEYFRSIADFGITQFVIKMQRLDFRSNFDLAHESLNDYVKNRVLLAVESNLWVNRSLHKHNVATWNSHEIELLK